MPKRLDKQKKALFLGGYAYLLFENSDSVKNLLQNCSKNVATNTYYMSLSSSRRRNKTVQVSNIYFACFYALQKEV